MKKIHLIESIQSFLASDNAGDSKGVYHPEEIAVHLNNVFNQSVYNAWLNGKKYSEFSQLDAWSKVYEIDVVDQVGAKAYALLPFSPVQLPDGLGLRQISDHDTPATVLVPIEATASVVFGALDVNTISSVPTYSLEQNSHSTGAGEESHMLRLEKLPTVDTIDSLDVLMIVPFDQLDDYDDVAMPSGMEENMISQVIEMMSNKRIPDTTNDEVIRPENQ